MKISGMQRPYIDATTPARRAAPQGGPGPAAKVAVSQEAKQLAEARAPAVSDTAKVQRLSLAIERGSFTIDAGHVADRMLSEER
jgi:flagellar biosynthesis anti-sigma factor FlgM